MSTVFTFKYEVNPVEEIVEKVETTLSPEIASFITENVACFTNKVPTRMLEGTVDTVWSNPKKVTEAKADQFDTEFGTKVMSGIKIVDIPGNKNAELVQKPENSGVDTEKKATSDHGPSINQEGMKIIKSPAGYTVTNAAGAMCKNCHPSGEPFASESEATSALKKFMRLGESNDMINFKYADLIEMYSTDLTESAVATLWDIEIVKENAGYRFVVLDGEDVIAEGVNYTLNTTKSAYRKCRKLEEVVTEKVSQPSRVLNIVKTLTK